MRKPAVIAFLLAVACLACSGNDDDTSTVEPPVGIELDCPEAAEIAGKFMQPLERTSSQNRCNYSREMDEDTDEGFTVQLNPMRATDTDAAIAWMECLAGEGDESVDCPDNDGEVITASDEEVTLRSHDPGELRPGEPYAGKGDPPPSSTVHNLYVRQGKYICSVYVRRSPANHELNESIETAARARARQLCDQLAG